MLKNTSNNTNFSAACRGDKAMGDCQGKEAELSPLGEVKKLNTKWHTLDSQEVINKLGSDLQLGLSMEEVADRIKLYGYNQIITEASDSMVMRFLRQFHHALIYILLISAAITIYISQWVDASVILGVVILNAIFGFFQEGKAEKALKAIHAMLAPMAIVMRAGRKVVVKASDLVPGDIVIISRGDKVPADIRLCIARNLQAQEAILTGESAPSEKATTPVSEDAVLAERHSMLYGGTIVSDGRGIGVVVATGAKTEVGKIGDALRQIDSITTPLLQQMNVFGRWLTVIIAVLALVVFVISVAVWNDYSSQMFMAIVGLTVAIIPEGLPPIMTIILAIGVMRMAKRNAIVRRLPAVETMGAVTTICTDKTGTLTNNELEVQTVATSKMIVSQQICSFNDKISQDEADLYQAIVGGILCNDAELHYKKEGGYEVYGNPIDIALMTLGEHAKLNVRFIQEKYPRIDLIPYETEHKFMATLNHDHSGNKYLYVKGAPEVILDRCKVEQLNGSTVPINIENWQKNIEELASSGQRVIAIAFKKVPEDKLLLNFSDIENELIFIGLFGLMDLPRAEVGNAVKECRQAGIKVKMITGDHARTAAAIAALVGIEDGHVLTGKMIDDMSDEELALVAPDVNVYARTTPQHKLRLVKALQQRGEIVAMTGDGINDAPALRRADIGVAMGGKGADIAKESAAMVLTDDNFATIVHAVSEGRTIRENLQKAILFILPTGFAEGFAVIIAIIFGLTLPISAVQILWINMVTAVTLSLSLGFEPSAHDVMLHPPLNPNRPLISWYLMWRIFLVSLVLVMAVFGLFVLVYQQSYSLAVARTVAVNMLVVGEAVYLINCRNLEGTSFKLQAFFGSKPVLLSILVVMLLQVFITYVPIMQKFFGTGAISFQHWLYILLAGVAVFSLVELEKILLRR